MGNYNSNIVKKPWGYEYLAYENENVGLWFLYIAPGQSTSMHCHPQKTTGLVLLDGEAEISFLADSRKLKSLDKVMIRRGLFHSTKATSDKGAFIFEIETPVDKKDLVRLNDQYGRASKPYEDSSFEETKNDNCLWIEPPKLGEHKSYSFANCILKIETINDINVINNKDNKDLIMFLKGGLVRNIDGVSHCVTIPGDVGFVNIIKQVSNQLDGVAPETIIMTIIKNG
jgi:mannose-6-phosphate isomerase-like protein (cupin superfamily)